MVSISLLSNHGGGLSNGLKNLLDKTGSNLTGKRIDNRNNIESTVNILIATYSPTLKSDTDSNFRLEIDYYKNLINSLKSNDHLVFISSQTLELTNQTYYSKAKSKVELMLRDSQKNYTIVRPGMIFDSKKKLFTLSSMQKSSKSILTFFNDFAKTTACTVEDIYKSILIIASDLNHYSRKTINVGIRRYTFNDLQNLSYYRKYRLAIVPFFALKVISLFSTRINAYANGSASSDSPELAFKGELDN